MTSENALKCAARFINQWLGFGANVLDTEMRIASLNVKRQPVGALVAHMAFLPLPRCPRVSSRCQNGGLTPSLAYKMKASGSERWSLKVPDFPASEKEAHMPFFDNNVYHFTSPYNESTLAIITHHHNNDH